MRERIPVLKLNNKGVVLSGVAHDGSVHFKPPWGGRPFPTEHQKERATLFVKGRVHLVLLLESACVLRVEVIQRLCKPKLGRLSSKYAIDKASMMNKRKKKGLHPTNAQQKKTQNKQTRAQYQLISAVIGVKMSSVCKPLDFRWWRRPWFIDPTWCRVRQAPETCAAPTSNTSSKAPPTAKLILPVTERNTRWL